MSFGNKSADNRFDISNLVAEYFSSVYVNSSTVNFDCVEQNSVNVLDNGLKVTISDVFQAISNLKTTCSPGPDRIPSIVLKTVFTL